MERHNRIGYNQASGGFNAMCGFRQFSKFVRADEDDTTNYQAEVKSQNRLEEDNIPDNQQTVGDVSMEKGDGLDKNFVREKVKDTPKEKVGFDENVDVKLQKKTTIN